MFAKCLRKSKLILVVLLIFMSTTTVLACWAEPESFEIFSDDNSKVFVFIPPSFEDGVADAYAALYEIIDNERHPVYTVEGLSSFAYEGNFRFSTDMMHFARIFPQFGMDAFEVFSYGVRTRVVLRSDFIDDYESAGALTSVGPSYTVNWRIKEHATQDAVITIHTDEGIVHFNLATAKFDWETALQKHYEATAVPISEVQYSTYISLGIQSDVLPAPIAQTQKQTVIALVIAGIIAASGAIGLFVVRKRK